MTGPVLSEAARTLWCATILGEPASKANSRRQVVRKSKKGKRYVASIKSEKAANYVESALDQLGKLKPAAPYDCNVILDCFIWYASRRPDLDESLIMDVLQKAGVIANDRLIKQKHVYWGIDKHNPRALVTLSVLPTGAIIARGTAA